MGPAKGERLQHEKRIRQGRGTEEYPAEAGHKEGCGSRADRGDFVVSLQKTGSHRGKRGAPIQQIPAKQQTVIQAPHREMQGRAVPESADGKDDQDVSYGDGGGTSAAAEGNIHVISKPPGERDMPASPEFPDVCRKVGCPEIDGKPYPKERSRASGDIRVAGKIGVDLKGKEQGGGEGDAAFIPLRVKEQGYIGR